MVSVSVVSAVAVGVQAGKSPFPAEHWCLEYTGTTNPTLSTPKCTDANPDVVNVFIWQNRILFKSTAPGYPIFYLTLVGDQWLGFQGPKEGGLQADMYPDTHTINFGYGWGGAGPHYGLSGSGTYSGTPSNCDVTLKGAVILLETQKPYKTTVVWGPADVSFHWDGTTVS